MLKTYKRWILTFWVMLDFLTFSSFEDQKILVWIAIFLRQYRCIPRYLQTLDDEGEGQFLVNILVFSNAFKLAV